jgi:polyisoprenoid-binding protein YceI
MMKKMLAIGVTALLAAAILFGAVAYSYLQPAAEASGPIQAAAITQTTAGATTYTIDQASSEARFVIDETLNGSPVTVVGTTDQVAGQIALDLENPSAAQVGTIQINARTLATDSSNRDRATQNQILKTGQYEYITFVPTALKGLPESATAGQSYRFQIAGQLTIAGQTREATFNATVAPTAEGTLQGNATTAINYADWGISIPQVPFVTGLADSVTLVLDFVAMAS